MAQADEKIEEPNNFNIRIAVDFGTDGIGLAYATNVNNVFVQSTWGNGKYHATVKSKTIILLDSANNNKFINMGMDAKYNYVTVGGNKDNWLLFERFKMALYTKDNEQQGGKQKINEKLTATNGTELDATIVFVAAFKQIKVFADKMLKRKRMKGIKKKDIQWIITVPAIWDNVAKIQMRNWAVAAGLVDERINNQCKIVYEPDCASLSVQMERSKGGDDQKQMEPFHEGDKYILIDAGGGTLDIVCHQVLKGGNVKEVVAPSGGPLGSTYIDDKFEELLHHLFSKQWVKEFEDENSNHWIAAIDAFQKAKAQFYEERTEFHNVMMPMEFVAFMQDKLNDYRDGMEVEDFVAEQRLFGINNKGKVKLDDETLEIHVSIWRIMFDHVMEPTIDHVKQLLKKREMQQNCKYCCLVGGLSTSEYFRERMTTEFGPKSRYKLEMVIPKRPMLSVVRGAALMGVIDDHIAARVLPYTYGYILALPESEAEARGIPDEHLEDNVVEAPDHPEGWLIQNCFEALATKGEKMKAGKTKTSHAQRAKATDKTSTISLYCSDKKDPKVKDDGEHLGDIVIEWDENDEAGCGVTVELHFTEALLKAEVYKDSDPNNKQFKYITNCKG